MSISILTRAYNTSELRHLIDNLNSNDEIEKEIIAVCNVNDFNIKNTKLIIENSNRFKARITAIKNAHCENILLLDSDQIPGKGLLSELDKKEEDMIIIPEKSLNSGFTARCLDDWRYRNERLAKKKATPYSMAIPRFYKRISLVNTINRLPEDIYNILSHEDSILYFEVFKETNNIGFSKQYIYNYDPNFFNLMKKAFLYGKYKKDMKSMEIPDNIRILIDTLNKSVFNVKELGIGRGYIIQMFRGILYEIGNILG